MVMHQMLYFFIPESHNPISNIQRALLKKLTACAQLVITSPDYRRRQIPVTDSGFIEHTCA